MTITEGEIEGKRRKKQNKGTLFKCTCLSNYLDSSDSLMFGWERELNKKKNMVGDNDIWWNWGKKKKKTKQVQNFQMYMP